MEKKKFFLLLNKFRIEFTIENRSFFIYRIINVSTFLKEKIACIFLRSMKLALGYKSAMLLQLDSSHTYEKL